MRITGAGEKKETMNEQQKTCVSVIMYNERSRRDQEYNFHVGEVFTYNAPHNSELIGCWESLDHGEHSSMGADLEDGKDYKVCADETECGIDAVYPQEDDKDANGDED